ncbi:hypothetical protein JTB14_026051 [Gonioctena quinquepunctata]|nr:hypothetical protein JTB14_026051 [Gonioctena quinquepunctata]
MIAVRMTQIFQFRFCFECEHGSDEEIGKKVKNLLINGKLQVVCPRFPRNDSGLDFKCTRLKCFEKIDSNERAKILKNSLGFWNELSVYLSAPISLSPVFRRRNCRPEENNNLRQALYFYKNSTVRNILQKKWEEVLYSSNRDARKRSRKLQDTEAISMDFQENLPVPNLSTNNVHYKLLERKRFDTFKEVFAVRGHSYMECDKNMGLINCKTRTAFPEYWVQVFKDARAKPSPFKVEKFDRTTVRD